MQWVWSEVDREIRDQTSKKACVSPGVKQQQQHQHILTEQGPVPL